MAGWRISRCGERYSLDRNLSPRYLARYQDTHHVKCLPSQAVSFPKKGMANNDMEPPTQCAHEYSCVPHLLRSSFEEASIPYRRTETHCDVTPTPRSTHPRHPSHGAGVISKKQRGKDAKKNDTASSLSQGRPAGRAEAGIGGGWKRPPQGSRTDKGATCNSRQAAGSA